MVAEVCRRDGGITAGLSKYQQWKHVLGHVSERHFPGSASEAQRTGRKAGEGGPDVGGTEDHSEGPAGPRAPPFWGPWWLFSSPEDTFKWPCLLMCCPLCQAHRPQIAADGEK